MLEVWDVHRLNLLTREIGLGLHDLTRGVGGVAQHLGESFLFSALLHEFDHEIHAVAVGKGK